VAGSRWVDLALRDSRAIGEVIGTMMGWDDSPTLCSPAQKPLKMGISRPGIAVTPLQPVLWQWYRL